MAFHSDAQYLTYKNFNHRNGMLMNAALSVCQANDGGILIGTEGAGIVEYDGYHFQEILTDESESQFHVSKIINDRNGFIFVDQYKGIYQISKNGSAKLLMRDKIVRDYLDLVIFADDYYIFHRGGIQRISKGQHSTVYLLKNELDEFEVSQKIILNDGIILFTNKGNFFLTASDGKIKPLSSYLNSDSKIVDRFKFGFTVNQKLHLYTDDFKLEYVLYLGLNQSNRKLSVLTLDGDAVNTVISHTTFNTIKNCFTLIDEKGKLYEIHNSKVVAKEFNFTRPITAISELISDFNGDYWASSRNSGLFKISEEPFTKINFGKNYRDKNIFFTYTTKNGTFIYSSIPNGTYYGEIESKNQKFLPYQILSATVYKDKYLFATNQGVLEFNEQTNSFSPFLISSIDPNKRVQFIFSDGEHLWISAADQGLHKYHPETKKDIHYLALKGQSSDVCYTAQKSKDNEYLYVGGNNGIFKYDLKTERIARLPLNDFGFYCGLSATDIFGNNWFCLESGLIGIVNGEIKKIQDKKYFPSKLFYTFNADQFGNLMVGTNKGINLLKVNDEGVVLKQSTYDIYSGFEGYETNMRSSSSHGNEIYFGTVEGLFQFNSTVFLFMESPKPPCILNFQSKKEHQKGIIYFEVTSKNPKTRLIYHTYRIPELSTKWKPISSLQKYTIDNLANGEYTIEVKSTYDGFIFSESSKIKVLIDKPFYQSSSFIAITILLILAVNIFLLFQSNRVEKRNSFLTDEYFIVQRIAPNLILFGTISLVMLEFIVQQLHAAIISNYPVTIIVSFILLSLYFISINNRINRNIHLLKQNLFLAFTLLLGYCFFMLYLNDLHPYYAFTIFLVTSVTPFVFNNIRYTIIFGFCFVFLCILIAITAKDPAFQPIFFIVAVIIDALLFILMTYMRNDSVHKLAFISAVINKGNIPTLAFDNNGVISYVSKNIEFYTGLNDEELIEENITKLNQFIAGIHDVRINDVTFFSENYTKRTIPMITPAQELIWMEWEFKKFSEDVNVIFGQNVTERIQLQNTYEQLVQNAEDYIYQVDVNGVFSFVNDRFYDKLDYKQNELVGRLSLDVVDPEYKQYVLEFYQNHFTSRKQNTYLEFPILAKNGDVVWLGQYVTTLHSQSQPHLISGFLAVGRDITLKRVQEQIIQSQNESITASINYAKRIQMNLLPSNELMETLFHESFVFFRPKDIVSGDFYWVRQIGDFTVIVIGDSTGHGVPGAFMSLLGINLLNSIVHEKQLLNPGRTLDDFDVKLRQSLPKENNGNSVNDGMELTICVLNANSDSMLYACAGSKFLVHDGTDFSLFKGDNKHIGDDRPVGFNGYVTHHATLSKRSTIYLFTDGFQDQFGGRKEKKYSLRRLLELLEENIRLPLSIQSQMINKEFDNWKGDEEQTDDVTVIAIRKRENN